LGGLSPECEWVRRLEQPAKRFKRGHRPDINGELFGLLIERPAVNDLNVRSSKCAVARVVLSSIFWLDCFLLREV